MASRLLLPFLLAINVAAEPSVGIRHGRISDLPRHLQLAKMNAVPLSAAATTIAQGTSFVFSYLNSHLNAKDTTYTENLALSITNPTDQIASVTITSSYANFTTINTIVGGGEVKTASNYKFASNKQQQQPQQHT